jgi:primosomal protein N' (replication factor Y)
MFVCLRLALPTPVRRLFDYLPPQHIDNNNLIIGIRVKVPFRSRTLIGILVEIAHASTVPSTKLKTAIELLDSKPLLPKDVYRLCCWAADYYHHSLGEVLMSALPALLRKGRRPVAREMPMGSTAAGDTFRTLNIAQQAAVTTIHTAQNHFRVFLLNGVTGSGKTEVYLHAIANILNNKQQILVLVPEISLTPQVIERFRARFAIPIAALHSGLSEQERLATWLAAKSGMVSIVIGTRSAIFTPFANLGLIIVDEEHDNSFKQQDRFRYHARDLAIMRANMGRFPIVLGSATPSLESLYNVKRGRYQVLLLPDRAGEATLPRYVVLDLRSALVKQGLSRDLLDAMQVHLRQGNQVILFLNRRGFAPVLYCVQCGWVAECKRCDTNMVFHREPCKLHCHHCDARCPVPDTCMQCGYTGLQPLGLGTQRLEQTLMACFPHVPIIRVDRDNTRRKGAIQDLLKKINQQKQAILLGTQMLAKGHHFPRVTLVGIVDADSSLFSTDFRAPEQMGQLLLQVAGRAGRAERSGTVMIQTRYPDHALLKMLLHQGYQHFSTALLVEREQMGLPPYSYLAIFRAESYCEERAHHFLAAVKKLNVPHAITALGPVPALLARRKGLHCFHLLVKASHRGILQNYLKSVLPEAEKLATRRSVKWALDVDPVEM